MSSTEVRIRGADLNKMRDLEMRFCLHYVVCWVGAEAVRLAGYKCKHPDKMAVKILKRPHIKAYIGKIKRLDCKKFELKRHEILEHLASGALRDGKMFVNDKGVIHSNLNDLPDDVTRAIDSIKQKIKTHVLSDGTEVVEVETELKLMPKATCLDMAMKHKGLFAAEQVDHHFTFNLDELYEDQSDTIDVDPVQMRAIEGGE